MPTSQQQILEQTRALTAEERAKLIEVLLEFLHSPNSDIEKAWAEEIEQRVAALPLTRVRPRASRAAHC